MSWGTAVYPPGAIAALAITRESPRRVIRPLATPRITARKKKKAAPKGGYVRCSILYHLRVAGPSTSARLHNLMGTSHEYISDVARKLVDEGLAQITQPHRAVLFSLTDRGAAEAALVDRADVEFA